MALLYPGYSGWVSGGTPEYNDSLWDLDQLVIPWRGSVPDLEAFLATHPMGEVAPGQSQMYLVSKPNDPHPQWPSARLVYMGRKGGILPPQQGETDDDVMSASSKISSTGTFLTQPLTVEYYAPAEILTYYTFGGKGTQNAPVPVGDPRPITVTCFDQTFAITGATQAVINLFFSVEIIATIKTAEMVPGRWWKNVARTNKKYSPFIFTPPPSGPFLTLWSPGTNYRVGDTLTISGASGNASVTVTQTLVLWGDPDQGGVYAWTVGSDTFTQPETGLLAHGGYGQGCGFNVAIIP